MGPAGTAQNSGFARAAVLATLLAGLGALFIWWGWRQGAYFGVVFYPGAIAVFLLLVILLASAPFAGGLRGAPLWGLAGLLGLATWMLISMLWTSTQASAAFYVQHAFLYAAMFMVGVWVCVLLARERTWSLAPVAVAGIAVAVATTIAIGSGNDVTAYLHGDATLRFPLGYRNANAAFFLIFLWPALSLACDPAKPWLFRAAMVGGATAMLELALLAQSRGSAPAAALAAIVWIGFSPARLRCATVLALVLAPVAVAAPTLLDVFQHGEANAAAVPLLHDAARAIAVSSLAAFGLASVWAGWIAPRTTLAPATQRRLGWVVAIAAAACLVAGTVAFTSREGGPAEFVERRVDEFTGGGITDFSGQNARFGVNVGSNRDDFWRVSVDQAQEEPLLGGGAGSFQLTYLRQRSSPESPRDPHSLEMLMLSELGLPGLLLLLVFLGATAFGAVRSRQLGPAAALVSAGALAAVAYWTIHASYDWFWNYPALTAPMAYLAGVAVGPAVSSLARVGMGRAARISMVALWAALALAAVPLYLSQRYQARALGEWQGNADAAYRDLDRAASLNPFDTAPLLYKGGIARRLGDQRLALEAFEDAAGREPENYAPHLFLAEALRAKNPAAARAELARARRLNPYEEGLEGLARQLREQSRRRGG